ncbi:ArnT family glycosyltransferase [Undibacterium fentianense]|uniref:Glycosyltransferase n=1 Tax=Undibacterium fentianense TaxID=2828728 RepID=A0A941E3Y3_9BURK|nr:glycosyltransferase [Undibacterium fentianense]MBR7800144.1 glycosyltransferase [Undibacterium fentianense]
MKPVRLPASATIALPRWSIFALCLLYILPGLIGRDPWKGADAAGFGVMWTMAHGNLQDWLWPHVVGLPVPEEGPLAFWLGALCIKLFGSLIGDPMAARIATGLAFLLGSISVWYSTYLLGRRTEAQPLKLAFGGQPEPRDFGRTLADGALLIYLGCLGLLLPSHTTSSGPLFIALIGFLLYLSIRFFDAPNKVGALKIGLVLGLLVLTRGWVIPLGILISLLILCRYRKQNLETWLLFVSTPIALLVVGAWLFTLQQVQPFTSSPYQAWMEWNYRQLGAPIFDNAIHFLRYGIWFAWPAWPFAAWAIYAWRKQERSLHISLPLAFLICFSSLALLNRTHEEGYLLPLLPPLAILAAFGLPTMKRSAINAVDWFAVMVMTGAAGLFWFGWIAFQSGWPQRTSKKILSWAPGYTPEFHFLVFILAIAISVIWFRIVYWRISRQPSVLWRAVVLSSGGVILCWFLIMSLWMPLINHRVSYSEVAQEMAAKLPTTYRCIDSKLGASQRASFAYFSKVHFAGLSEQNCDLLLTQANRRFQGKIKGPVDKDFPGTWEMIWEGQRAADKDEYFTLYRKIEKNTLLKNEAKQFNQTAEP